MIELESSIRLVSIQFNFSRSNLGLPSLRRIGKETEDQRGIRSERLSGVLLTEPVKNVSLAEFVEELNAAGYELADAYCQRRRSLVGRLYRVVRFIFVRHEYAIVSDEFKQKRESILSELRDICRLAMWQAELFLNPFYEAGNEMSGQHHISINLSMRRPLFDEDGKPIMVWRKNRDGEQIGDSPITLESRYRLRIEGNVIKLFDAGEV